MRTYGKEPESLESIISLFYESTADYGIEEILSAMHFHAKKSPDFPTPADIISIMESVRFNERMKREDEERKRIHLIETSKPEYIERLRRYKSKGIPLSREQEEYLAKATPMEAA